MESIKTVINIGIGTITLDVDGAENSAILENIKDELLTALDTTSFDIQEVKSIWKTDKGRQIQSQLFSGVTYDIIPLVSSPTVLKQGQYTLNGVDERNGTFGIIEDEKHYLISEYRFILPAN